MAKREGKRERGRERERINIKKAPLLRRAALKNGVYFYIKISLGTIVFSLGI